MKADTRVLKALAKITSKDSLRPNINCIEVTVGVESTTYRATDGHIAIQVEATVASEETGKAYLTAKHIKLALAMTDKVNPLVPMAALGAEDDITYPDFDAIMGTAWSEGNDDTGEIGADPILLSRFFKALGDTLNAFSPAGKPVRLRPANWSPMGACIVTGEAESIAIKAVFMPMRLF